MHTFLHLLIVLAGLTAWITTFSFAVIAASKVSKRAAAQPVEDES